MKFILLLALLISHVQAQSDIDERLQSYVKEFGLSALQGPPAIKRDLFVLGRTLFTSNLLSGNKNIGCVSCHHPGIMTHDNLPLALGEGAQGIQSPNSSRMQAQGKIIARNSPALFNLHGINILFWDGRVSFDPESGTFSTPVAALNGPTPLRQDITSTLKSALAAQAIFPIADPAEMRGAPGSNEIADAVDELAAWDLIVKRLLSRAEIKKLFNNAFPGEKINIGHVGEALAEFQRQAFAFNDTPYDQYLKGDLTALTDLQKKGMDVFFNKASCGNCHNGTHLTSFEFDSVGIPQIGPGKHNGDDLGRHAIDSSVGIYTFRVPPLRNVGVTAPYMHNGAFKTLEEVVEHYDMVAQSLRSYNFEHEWKNYIDTIANHDHSNDRLRLSSLADDLEPRLDLSVDEEEALVEFLSRGLTDKRLLRDN